MSTAAVSDRLPCGSRFLDLAHPQVMGILNVTPDSFSDGGRFARRDAALRHAAHMVEAGASLIDIGGESTRPGAAAVSEAEELERVVPVVEAMARVPREEFVPDESRPLAYIDRTIAIGDGRLMSGPVVLGMLLTEMVPVPGERALVVGCGTGYSVAVLNAIGLDTVGLECSAALAKSARDNGVRIVEGPLEQGWPGGAPYDLILIDGAVEYIPDAIVAQLSSSGRIATSLVERGVARLVLGRRAGKGFGLHSIADFGAAALPGFVKPRGFSF